MPRTVHRRRCAVGYSRSSIFDKIDLGLKDQDEATHAHGEIHVSILVVKC